MAVRRSAELGALGWEGVDLIRADRERYGLARRLRPGDPVSLAVRPDQVHALPA